MTSLWLTLVRFRLILHGLAFDEGHAVKMFTEDTGGQQPSHAGAEDDGMGSILRISIHWVAPWVCLYGLPGPLQC